MRGAVLPSERERRSAADRLINAASDLAHISCVLDVASESADLELRLGRGLEISGSAPDLRALWETLGFTFATVRDGIASAFRVTAGLDTEPVIAPPVLYLHSYRKVTTGATPLGDILGGPEHRDRGPVSAFKFAVLTTLLARADLLEEVSPTEATQPAVEMLNALTRGFAGVGVEKMGLSGDELDIRVINGRDGPSMPFDALSSGQKEIISTLFLIWEATRDCPSVVLIDEPELHLHPQWHSTVIRKLWELAPWNQYIIATHSGEIARSVERDRLCILEP